MTPRCPWPPPPREELTDAALVLSVSRNRESEVYVGLPLTLFTSSGKESMISVAVGTEEEDMVL